MKSLTNATRNLAKAFVAQYPVVDQPPHTSLTSPDLDKFGIAQGVYNVPSPASAADLNAARSQMVERLNKAGRSEDWIFNGGDGFRLDVFDDLTNGGGVTSWLVRPLPVSVSTGWQPAGAQYQDNIQPRAGYRPDVQCHR